MAMSDDYWSKTKPNGMPDYVWQEMQAKKKAEEEAKKKPGSVVTGGNPLSVFGIGMQDAANKTVESDGKETPITDAFVETLLDSETMQENYKNAEEGSLAKDKADAALESYSQKNGISQEALLQINSLLQSNSPNDVIYNPTDYAAGTYAPLVQGSPTLNTTSDEVAKYALAIMQAAKGKLGDVDEPDYMTGVEKPGEVKLRTLEDLAKMYGITYNYDEILGRFNDSVEKQYDAIYERQKQNEDKYYDNAVAAQNSLLDTLSRDRSNAVSAGVSKGMQAANALGAMLGVSQQFADNATALSQERSNTAKDYGAALAKAIVDADATSNERKNAIMEIAKMLYGYDSEQYVANMDNYNTILTNNAGLQQTYLNNKAALQNALASIFNSSASSKITGDANIQASQATAEANRLAAQYAAEAQRYAAHQSAEANKAAAAYAAQGNVNAYKEYANALIAQATINAGALTGSEIETTTPDSGVDARSKEIAEEKGVGYTNINGVPLSTIYGNMPGATKYVETPHGTEVYVDGKLVYIMQ